MTLMLDTPESPAGPAKQFEDELLRWITPLRESLTALLRELQSPATPRVLQRQLGVPYAACWRVFRIVQAIDVTAEAQHAPSPGGLKKLLVSAQQQGATARTVAAVALAAEQFRKFITRHAEDRAAFDSMVAGAATKPGTETLVLQRRRTVYRALSHLWGVQTDLHCLTSLIGPADGDPTNHVTLVQQRGIRRLRADTQVTLAGYRVQTPGGTGADAERIALDPEAAERYGMPILPAFSSKPLPEVQATVVPTGWCLYNMVGGNIGLGSNFDCTFASSSGKQTYEIDANGQEAYYVAFTTHRKPLALLVMDLIVHRDSFPGIKPQSMIHQYLEGFTSIEAGRQAQKFPSEDKVGFAGRADLLNLIEAPNYGELLRYAAEKKGWNLADFDAYRMRIPYPIFSTTAQIYFHTSSI